MQASFRAFAEELIDYAGMFPPAELPLEEAARNYLRYRRGPDAWMQGRFICRTERLRGLLDAPDLPPAGEAPVRIAALGRGGGDLASFRSGLEADTEAMLSFQQRVGGRAAIEAFEVRVPAVVQSGSDSSGWRDFITLIPGVTAPVGKIRIYYEGGFTGSWRDSLAALIEAVAAFGPEGAGVKLRCGGVTAAEFPSVEQVAFFIDACRRAGARFKATAGLHHPVRSFRDEVGTKMHGFLNVFGAALLAREHDLGEERIGGILADEEPSSFRFTDPEFAWRDLRIPAGRIGELRRAVTSFGSCSFDEPRADLRALGIPVDGPDPRS